MIFIEGFPFDLAVSQDSTYSAEITEHPVDADADVTDYIRLTSGQLVLECVVSNTPTGAIAAHETRRDPVLDPSGDPYIAEAAFDKLLELRARRRPVTVETPKRTYDSMGIGEIVRNENAASSGGALFTVTFHEVRIAQNKRVTVRVAVPLVKAPTSLGRKTGTEINGEAVTNVIYVITFPVEKRAFATKGYGSPVAKDVTRVRHAGSETQFVTRPAFDCYRVLKGRERNAEGYLVPIGQLGSSGEDALAAIANRKRRGLPDRFEYYEFATLTNANGIRRDSAGQRVATEPGKMPPQWWLSKAAR